MLYIHRTRIRDIINKAKARVMLQLRTAGLLVNIVFHWKMCARDSTRKIVNSASLGNLKKSDPILCVRAKLVDKSRTTKFGTVAPCVLNMKPDSCHCSGAQNFELSRSIFETLLTRDISCKVVLAELNVLVYGSISDKNLE